MIRTFCPRWILPLIAQIVQRRKRAVRNGGGFFVGHVGRFQRHHPVFGQASVLGIGAETETARREDLIALLEQRDIAADGFNFPGQTQTLGS